MNTEEYFAPTCTYTGPSIADEQAQWAVDELSDAFDRFLKEIGCQRTPDSEWYYSCQHSGIHATYDTSDVLYFEPTCPDESYDCLYCDQDFRECWGKFVPRLQAMFEWLENHEHHLDDAPYELKAYTYNYVKRRHRRDERRWDVMYAAYEEAVDEALEELCDTYEKLLEAECDYAYSEEAAKDWLRANGKAA